MPIPGIDVALASSFIKSSSESWPGSPCGTGSGWAHLGHLIVLPANSSFTRNAWPHAHVTLIGIALSAPGEVCPSDMRFSHSICAALRLQKGGVTLSDSSAAHFLVRPAA